MNWSKWNRQIHRWISVIFVLAVIVTTVGSMQEQPPEWVYFLPLLPLLLLAVTGIYLFVLPYAARWRNPRERTHPPESR